MFKIIPDGKSFKEHVLLKNGEGILIRAAKREDIPLVSEFMKRLSKESLRMRFMAAVNEVPQNIIEDLCTGDFVESGCLLAIINEETEPKVIGLGNFISMGDSRSAEVAFLVQDEYQGRGISTIILERLAGICAANGYIELVAEVLPDNQQMLNVFKNSGFKVHQLWDSDAVHIELPVIGGASLWEQAAMRERIAVANSLMPILKPKKIAVIGASRDKNSIGNMIFRNILSNGFTGTVYPVNPKAESVNGVKAYKSVEDLPEEIELAVIAVPAKEVIKVSEEAANKGAKGLIVVSAGFAESGKEGKKRQEKLLNLVRNRGMRLIGPSCLGVMNTHPEVNLNASLAPTLPERGTAGFFSHSAALGLVILNYAKKKGIGFTTYVSAGNRADVSGNDLLQYWYEDSNTKLAILYLETFGNPRKFVRIARNMSRKKPILCIKTAKSKAGRKKAEEKTGKSGGGKEETEALFHQAGIIVADTLDELFDIAMILVHQPLPQGKGVGIIANSAGFATLFADSSEANGLEIKEENLINLGAFAKPDDYTKSVKELLLKENVHSLLVGFACVGNCGPEDIAQSIKKGVVEAERENGIKKPVLLCLMGMYGTVNLKTEYTEKNEEYTFPAFRFPESAPKALSQIVKYSEFIEKPVGKIAWYEDTKGDKARKLCQKYINEKEKNIEILLKPEEAKEIIDCFNLPQCNNPNAFKCTLFVKPDPVFGPLLRLETHKGHSIVRITPITERDIEELVERLNLPECNKIGEIFGRVSQMIEEIPWLYSLKIPLSEKGIIAKDIKMALRPSGFIKIEF
ncbi:conserved hypothetical protein [Thermotomaculum hydrothermale]|uniref:N-acetyltransferase domain-containing protein n=1 Tax=Thermotomaculum hydrothermale TaxID=981385 RepID=A0A7R6PNY9_9BACT|nr:GNAT family N-acetyltransferase [Thermotomaculum hydrothermale]BBB32616.1 conserved hypothetical protein [Thermotomaculum hydrothermale]